jgi:hypothetical protein
MKPAFHAAAHIFLDSTELCAYGDRRKVKTQGSQGVQLGCTWFSGRSKAERVYLVLIGSQAVPGRQWLNEGGLKSGLPFFFREVS